MAPSTKTGLVSFFHRSPPLPHFVLWSMHDTTVPFQAHIHAMAQTTGETTAAATASATTAVADHSAAAAAAYALRTSTAHLAGSKLRKQLSGSLQEHLSAPTSAFAHEQLKKMGWTAGTGLGKKRDGIKTHIKVKKRKDQEGIGAGQAAAAQRTATEEWWKDSIGGTLAKLSKGKKEDKKKGKRKERYTDEELFEATGGARFGMRAAPTKNLNKWLRTESEVADDETPVKVSVDADNGIVSKAPSESALNEVSLEDPVNKKEKKKAKKAKKAKREGAKEVVATDERKRSKDKKTKKKKRDVAK